MFSPFFNLWKMSKENGVVVAFGLIWIAIKMSFFLTGNSEQGFFAGGMANILFILLICFWALKLKYDSLVTIAQENGTENGVQRKLLPEDSNFLDDVKTSMKAAGKYILIIAASVFIYYSVIDSEYSSRIIDQRVQLAKEQTATEESWQKVLENAPTLSEISKEEYIQHVREDAEVWTSPGRQTSITLFGLFLLAIFYSLLLVVTFRKLLYRKPGRQ